MPNGVHKPSEFDASTRVMESDLLRVLTHQSSDSDGGEVATHELPHVADAQPRRGSRVFVVAAVVAAVVIAFDASLFVMHQRRATRAAAAPVAADPMPRYRLLPLGTPPPVVEAARAEAPAPSSPAIVAAVVTDSTTRIVHAHRHSHHRHASH